MGLGARSGPHHAWHRCRSAALRRHALRARPVVRGLFECPAPIIERDALADTHKSSEARYWLLEDIEALLEQAALGSARIPSAIGVESPGAERAGVTQFAP